MGEEMSLLAVCDGVTAVPLASAQDYKRIFNGDLGPNTGGMGSYSPVPSVDDARAREICAAVHQPVLDVLARRGSPFHGVLYAGPDDDRGRAEGDPRPRVQRPLRRSRDPGDPAAAALGPARAARGRDRARRAGRRGAAGVDRGAWRSPSSWPVPATRRPSTRATSSAALTGCRPGCPSPTPAPGATATGQLVTKGGRVLSVTALGATPTRCRAAAYAAANMIHFDGKQMRRDIALKLVG